MTEKDNFDFGKELGLMQASLINANLTTLPDDEKQIELQRHWNMFKATLNVSSFRADIMQSKYYPLLFAYQEIFNFKGGRIPKIEGINTNSDTTEYEKEIIKYLDKKNHDRSSKQTKQKQ